MYSEEELDRLIDEWHDDHSLPPIPLWINLGWTWAEYGEWLESGRQPGQTEEVVRIFPENDNILRY